MTDLQIGTLNLRLPPVLEHRAGALAREVGTALNQIFAKTGVSGSDNKHLGAVSVPVLTLDPALSDKRLGLQIAAAICNQLQAHLTEEN